MATRTAPSRDGIALLRDDHATARRLFRDYRRTGQRAHAAKRKLVDRIITELSVHAGIEETVFYPRLRAQDPELLGHVLESLEEHHVVKLLCSELERMDPRDERFDAKVQVLSENVEHHMEEEEKDIFPRVRRAFRRDDLRVMGEDLAAARTVVPSRPHPHAPDQPPGNVAAALVTAPVDGAVTALKGVVRRAVTA
ncbi:MAG: hemerythrin domain-containing protein [Candidatus Dormibacteria bacterium]